ncbi:GatB/YqeY domain-containing protein [Actinoplanes solisilvae]|uniref:GatB/YqeY domain-containing protein n=1 Tax=Actinoplanes solisilvae TaxID=2486853 RepID=UPI000FDA9759|nr:GatB/YqeY domain-containing protein [Actinoplanes solisilvae]
MTETPLRERLRKALPGAMKAKDRAAVSALRATLAALDNAEAVAPAEDQLRGQAIEEAAVGAGATEVARQVLSDDDVVRIVRAEADEREQAAAEYRGLGRDDRAEQLLAEALVLRGHLA